MSGKNKDNNYHQSLCANCFVCKEDSEFCPKSKNYDPDSYLKLEEKLKRYKQERSKNKEEKKEKKY